MIDKYLKLGTWEVNENASSTYSIGGLLHYISSSVVKDYWLKEVYTEDISNAHKEGYIHIHDLGFLGSYCCGHSLRELITTGLTGGEGTTTSAPAKHYFTIVQHMVNYLGIMSQEFAGAQAFSSVDTYLAPFIHKDKLSYNQVKQGIQFLVYGLNIKSRWSGQAPFTNFTFDLKCPEDMASQSAIVGGAPYESYTYNMFQREMDMINLAFVEIMLNGDSQKRGFSFPIPTYNITKDFNWDGCVAQEIFSLAGKYGTPYFQNFISSDLDPTAVKSMCCRLSLNLDEIRNVTGGLFGSADNTGSIGVVTLNIPMIVKKALTEGEDIHVALEKALDISYRSLELKRAKINQLLNDNLYPHTKIYLKNYSKFFSTIGLVGMNEACMMAIGVDLTQNAGIEYAEKMLKFIKNWIKFYQNATGHLYNLEATPAESTSYRLAMLAKKAFPDIIHAGTEETPYFTNSTHLPVGATDDLFEALTLQEPLQIIYSGGTVFHAMLTESIADKITVANLIKSIFTHYKIPYLSLTPTYSICKEHGYLKGQHYSCPKCGSETEVYSRIVGYYRPVKNWNRGKKQEYVERKTFNPSKEELNDRD